MKRQCKLEKEIETLYSKIRVCENLQCAFEYINQLMRINETIGKMIFVEKVKVSDKLWNFFKDFDLSYDNNMQEFFFRKIKQKEYIFE